MSYLDKYDEEVQRNVDESRFSETSEYLVDHFVYANSVERNQSETTKRKLSGALVGILSERQYQQTLVKYDSSENVVLYKNLDNDPNNIILDVSNNGAMKIPYGTTAQRPTVLRDGMIRLNTTTGVLEVCINQEWGDSLNSATAGPVIASLVDSYIVDISQNLNDRVTRDISNMLKFIAAA